LAKNSEGQQRLALLIDADNAPPGVVNGLLAEAARFGSTTVKRIYGDWTSPRLGQWKRQLLKHSIQPVQQFAYTSGKNATDSALIIDAMDLLYTRRFDGFCLVSSDSDFTRLAQRIREEGLTVYGFGEKKTPEPFVAACDKFIYTELLRMEPESGATVATETAEPVVVPEPAAKLPQLDAVTLIARAIEEVDDEDGWANLAPVGAYVSKLRPDFDARLFGHSKLSSLVRSLAKHFETKEVLTPGTGTKVLFVRRVTKAKPGAAAKSGTP